VFLPQPLATGLRPRHRPTTEDTAAVAVIGLVMVLRGGACVFGRANPSRHITLMSTSAHVSSRPAAASSPVSVAIAVVYVLPYCRLRATNILCPHHHRLVRPVVRGTSARTDSNRSVLSDT